MQFSKAGIILFTERYEECVDFYGRVLELEILHRIDRTGERLTAFCLGDCYLMIETGGRAYEGPKPMEANPNKLRFNVPDVQAASAHLGQKGIEVRVVTHSWGTTAEFCDPDGNRCALRSDEGFGA
ncbi:MAG: VOC family protein [Sulfitobacter sp.]